MRDYYSEFLEKNSENPPQPKVSKVSKDKIQPTERAFDTFDTLQSSEYFEKNLSLTARLDSIIRAGASFEVGAASFEIIGADKLTGADSDFLSINRSVILYTLQQAFLNETLFKYSTELFADFQTEVFELQAKIDGGIENNEVSFEAAQQITKAWFESLLKANKEA